MQIALTRNALLTRVLLVVFATALLTLSAKIKVPFYPVPMTMQVAVVLLLGAAGGARFAFQSFGAYLLAGAAGLPVFAGTPEKGIGLAYMTGPTGGYLLGFLVAAVLVGWAADQFGRKGMVLSLPVALVAIYALGAAWLAQFVPADKVMAYGVTPFVLGDLVKLCLAGVLAWFAPAKLTNLIRGKTDV
ncbi:biotin transporter BioY [Tropicibacter sp. R15_0]|uniref:biotin transporter BioY n=1 Tax=Tropicibacter sp. R15_0 TaxID=2821101 RepID=UPI001ADB3003|nr:biotin transporter BioY [Tropicibacter sp. R15_0]MBO9466034.1 biotin transporter BioY [Tropicibacter sp. R15_0]